jgi:hypothetical protein
LGQPLGVWRRARVGTSSLSDGDCHRIGEGSTVSSWPEPTAESTRPHTWHLDSPHVDIMCQLHHQRPDKQRQPRLCVRDLCLIQTPPPPVDKTTAWRPVQHAPRACPTTLVRKDGCPAPAHHLVIVDTEFRYVLFCSSISRRLVLSAFYLAYFSFLLPYIPYIRILP